MIVTAMLDTYERKSFQVKAVRVTAENIREIAEWTRGELKDIGLPTTNAATVGVPVGEVNGRVKREWAHIGDWVTSLVGDEKDFRVYKQSTFLHCFTQIMGETEKFSKVHELLLKLALAQDSATYHGDSSGEMVLLVEKTAREICNII